MPKAQTSVKRRNPVPSSALRARTSEMRARMTLPRKPSPPMIETPIGVPAVRITGAGARSSSRSMR